MSIEATPSKRMRLGDILLMRGLVDVDGLEAALDRQRELGGRIGESIVALGLISPDQLTAVLDETPTMPLQISQTGVSRASLLALVLKFMRAEACETSLDLSNRMRLSVSIIQTLIEHATAQHLTEVLGSTQIGNLHYLRYALTSAGRVAASEALAQNSYLGPAPVSLESFRAQVEKQGISNEKLSEEALRQGFADLIIPANYFRKLLPAVRASRTILLYGPPGNGKSSIGARLGKLFQNVIYIPYAIEVSGQIITLYDSRLHKPYTDEANTPAVSSGAGVQHESFDLRWVACRRPIALAGGELTLEMLDLRYDPITKFYDAPLHMKALNGMFLIDDFGRQKINPTELLNRWIMPLEDRIDYLMLTTGMSFQIPFDALVIFSTNLEPAQLMDQAVLRRIPYKIELFAPNHDEFHEIFFRSATAHGLKISDATVGYVLKRLIEAKHELAWFQPNFLCAQISQICSCFELPPNITSELVDEAMENLYVDMRR